VAASLHGDTPYSGNSVTPVPVTPYTTSVDVNEVVRDLAGREASRGLSAGEKRMLAKARLILLQEG